MTPHQLDARYGPLNNIRLSAFKTLKKWAETPIPKDDKLRELELNRDFWALVKAHTRFCFWLAWKYHNGPETQFEFFVRILHHAAKDFHVYDQKRGRFYTFLYWKAKDAYTSAEWEFHNRNTRNDIKEVKKRLSKHLPLNPSVTNPDAPKDKLNVLELIRDLDSLEQRCVWEVCVQGKTLVEAGKALGYSYEYVRQNKNSGLKKLRRRFREWSGDAKLEDYL